MTNKKGDKKGDKRKHTITNKKGDKNENKRKQKGDKADTMTDKKGDKRRQKGDKTDTICNFFSSFFPIAPAVQLVAGQRRARSEARLPTSPAKGPVGLLEKEERRLVGTSARRLPSPFRLHPASNESSWPQHTQRELHHTCQSRTYWTRLSSALSTLLVAGVGLPTKSVLAWLGGSDQLPQSALGPLSSPPRGMGRP